MYTAGLYCLFSSVSDPLIHVLLLSFIHLMQTPAALLSREIRLFCFWYLQTPTDVVSDGSHVSQNSRPQISVTWLLRNIYQCLISFPRFWWPGHRSVPVRHKHVQIWWGVPKNRKHGDLHLWLQGKACFPVVLFYFLLPSMEFFMHWNTHRSANTNIGFFGGGACNSRYKSESFWTRCPKLQISPNKHDWMLPSITGG